MLHGSEKINSISMIIRHCDPKKNYIFWRQQFQECKCLNMNALLQLEIRYADLSWCNDRALMFSKVTFCLVPVVLHDLTHLSCVVCYLFSGHEWITVILMIKMLFYNQTDSTKKKMNTANYKAQFEEIKGMTSNKSTQ